MFHEDLLFLFSFFSCDKSLWLGCVQNEKEKIKWKKTIFFVLASSSLLHHPFLISFHPSSFPSTPPSTHPSIHPIPFLFLFCSVYPSLWKQKTNCNLLTKQIKSRTFFVILCLLWLVTVKVWRFPHEPSTGLWGNPKVPWRTQEVLYRT